MKTNPQRATTIRIFWFSLTLLVTILIIWANITTGSFLRDGSEHIANYAFIFSSYALLSLALARSLTKSDLKHPIPYRIAFLLVVLLGIALILTSNTYDITEKPWENMVFIALGGFIGSFIAANLERGWWENNAPPSPAVEEEVLNWHPLYMDAPIKKQPLKRTFDIFLGLISLILSLPVWLIVTLMIWWEDPGPILFVKNAVGRGGVNFKQLKFRSMILQAEKETGPISGYENDERVLFFGRFLRKTALDEVPQLINILRGDMSYVGPRPQRTVLVHKYIQEMPAYTRRHRVRPGLAGLAQVTDSYDITPDVKLAWDLLYINRASLWLDIILLLSAFYLVFALRWLPDSHPELRIRKLLNISKPG